MQDFALAARALIQPISGTSDRYLDPTHSGLPQGGEVQNDNQDGHKDFSLNDAFLTTEPSTSPYGDIGNWDILWLGHCG
jgi:hypothetical protein